MTGILKNFPHTHYHAEARLVTWHPRGVLDDELADRIVAFIEGEERLAEEPFHRFTDFSGLTAIHLKFGHMFKISEQRRAACPGGQPVKSAFFSEWVIGFGFARLYEELMAGGPIEVRAFRTREAAAEWLGVPEEILLPKA